MLSFQSLPKFLIMFIVVCITHFAFTKAIKVICAVGFTNTGWDSVCWEKGGKFYSCPTKQCSYNNRQYAPMQGCTLDKTPGASNQQCTAYQLQGARYQCWNSGNVRYMCPKDTNTDFITCSDCKLL
ncbi:uncharacterized protein MELLADRAFT_123282 [Melampsora larici-populina 98AG31]|uniref:Secreted protein n=1 Tax=Melampsora larici-populina (strain 98AG31 / pathotype 3-4-7) TaxID=747676 RepID=F4RUZ7_MELLP|nr:uncharacterized protein MELLADRAFT_123282 [Melampsora larici-populina 98AG31]EGG03837.1 secreted protein [Melampsora larici-populina 98AG31]